MQAFIPILREYHTTDYELIGDTTLVLYFGTIRGIAYGVKITTTSTQPGQMGIIRVINPMGVLRIFGQSHGETTADGVIVTINMMLRSLLLDAKTTIDLIPRPALIDSVREKYPTAYLNPVDGRIVLCVAEVPHAYVSIAPSGANYYSIEARANGKLDESTLPMLLPSDAPQLIIDQISTCYHGLVKKWY